MATLTAPRPRRFRRDEYERMIEAGILGPGDHVELLEGEIVEISPEKSRHAATADLVAEALRIAYGTGFTVRVQHPLDLGEHSQPEPDVAVVPGSARDHVARHPRSAVLVVEVSDTSLDYDRSRKRDVYARSGIAEYWIVNLVDERIEVGRDPGDAGYRTVSIHGRGDVLACPGRTTRVSADDLLP